MIPMNNQPPLLLLKLLPVKACQVTWHIRVCDHNRLDQSFLTIACKYVMLVDFIANIDPLSTMNQLILLVPTELHVGQEVPIC